MNLPILGVSFIFKGREKTLECVYERKFIADKLWAYLVAFNSCQRRGMVANNPPWGGDYYCEMRSARVRNAAV